jgi:hypothetical protein
MSSLHVHLARLKSRSLKLTYRAYDAVMNTDKLIRYTYYNNGYHNPNYRFGKDEINFLHLPKTGGTSLCKILANDPKSRFGRLNIHRPVSKHCPPGEYKYVTVLRDPVARVWSYYQMVLRSESGYPYQKWARQGLEVFLIKCWAARNLATRYIAGVIDPEPTQETLSLALANLSQFYAVLNFAEFSEEVSSFLQAHEIPLDEIPNERNHYYDQPSAEQQELIRKYNHLDMALMNAGIRTTSTFNFYSPSNQQDEASQTTS